MLLLRHASACKRLSSPALDATRSLDRAGRAQAALLVQTLEAWTIERVLTSPLARCVETVVPLARALGIPVEVLAELGPDVASQDALALVRELPETALACTHREVFEQLFGGNTSCEKGGFWIVTRKGRRVVPAAYVPPPVVASSRRRAAVA